MRRSALMLVPAALTSVAAVAQDRPAEPFTGPSVAGIVGLDHPSQFGSKGTGLLYGGLATYDIAAGNTRFGVEAEASDATTSKCETNAVGRSCAKAERDLYIGGRIGTVISPATMLYAKAGYTNARVHSSYDFVSTAASPDFDGSGNSDGVRVGAGAEINVGQFLVRAEYRYSNYSDNYERHQGVIGIGVRF